MRKTLTSLLLSAAACVLLSACGLAMVTTTTAQKPRSPSPKHPLSSPTHPVSGHATVAIRDFMYRPMSLTVAAGTKVTFHNYDQTSHTATALNGGFDTGTIKPGRSVTVVLRKPGTYKYHCLFHAFMVASIVVERDGSS